MKKNELTDIIRTLVREEIRKQLPQALTEVFSSLMNGRQVVNEQISPQPQIDMPTHASFNTGNPTVDAIMKGISIDPSNFGSGPMVDLEEGFSRVGSSMAELMEKEVAPVPNMPTFKKGSVMDMIKHTISTPVAAEGMAHQTAMLNVPSILDCKSSIPAPVAKVFNRDFRSVMKAIEQKKKNGMIGNPMSVGQM